jgi:CHAT domain-containing protein
VYALRSEQSLNTDLKRFARRTELARDSGTEQRFQVQDIGKELWKEIFGDLPGVGKAYLQASAKSQTLMVQFETPREYIQLPLEFLYSDEPSEFVILRHPMARFVHNAQPRREALSPDTLALTSKLRVLIVAANTSPPIAAVDREAQELCGYLQTQEFIPVETALITSEEATFSRVERELETGNYDIVHYAGHGAFDPKSPGESCLYLRKEQDADEDAVMSAYQLKLSLDLSPTRLVYLGCCDGMATANVDELLDDDYLGLADAVVQAGVPSVLGFRWPVSDNGAREFALAFYESLLRQGSPEIAAWQARRKLARADRSYPTWLSPILIHQQ